MPSKIVLIHPETNIAEPISSDAVSGALQAGYRVPLNDSNGNPVAVSYNEAQRLITAGTHRQPSNLQLEDLVDAGVYGSPGQQALTFIEGMGKGLFGALAPVVESAIFPTTIKDIGKRAEVSPGVNLSGEMTGLVGGAVALPGASVAGLIGRAGAAATRAVSLTGKFGAAAKYAAQGAVEGGLYGASNKVHEAIIGNPNEVAEHMIAHVGISAALGSGFNLALAPIAKAVSNTVAKITGYAARAKPIPGGTDEPMSVEQMLSAQALPQKEREGLLKGLGKEKTNAAEIRAAAKIDDIEPTEPLVMQISDSKSVQKWQGSLAKDNTTIFSIQNAQKLDAMFKKINRLTDEGLGTNLALTKAQAGEDLKVGLINKISAESKPINDIYDAVKAAGVDVDLRPAALSQVSKNIMKIEGLTTESGKPIYKSSAEYKLAKKVSEEIKNLQTMDDLRLFGQSIGRDTIGKPELSYVAGQIQNKIQDLIDTSIVNQVRMFQEGSPLHSQFVSLLGNYRVAKELYAGFRDKLDTLGPVLGKKLRRGEGARRFIEWLQEVPPEKIADKLFTKNNSVFLQFLQKNFNEEFKLLSRLKKAQIREIATRDGEVNATAVLSQVYGSGVKRGLEPEIRKLLFDSEALKKINAARILREAMPPDINPSGTAQTSVLFAWNPLSPKSNTANLAAFAKDRMVKMAIRHSPNEAPLISALQEAGRLSYKTFGAIERRAGGLFSYGADERVGGLLGYGTAKAIDTKEKKKRKEQRYAHGGIVSDKPEISSTWNNVAKYQANPELLMDHLSSSLAPIMEYLPDISIGMSAVVSGGIGFLQSKGIKSGKMAPLDNDIDPSSHEVWKFNKYAEVVDNPLSVFDHIANGSLLPLHTEALTFVFPALYSRMKLSVVNKMAGFLANHEAHEIPYKTRLSLSTFLGQNLDSTMSQEAIVSNQRSFVTPELNSSEAPKKSSRSSRQMKSIPLMRTRFEQSEVRRNRSV